MTFRGCRCSSISPEDSEKTGIQTGDILLWLEGFSVPLSDSQETSSGEELEEKKQLKTKFLNTVSFGEIMEAVYPTDRARSREIKDHGGRRFGFLRCPGGSGDDFFSKYVGFDTGPGCAIGDKAGALIALENDSNGDSNGLKDSEKESFTVKILPKGIIVQEVPIGSSLLDAIISSGNGGKVYKDLNKITNCGGRGKCGTCRVRILDDDDGRSLGWRSLEEGEKVRGDEERLACWCDVTGDVIVEVLG